MRYFDGVSTVPYANEKPGLAIWMVAPPGCPIIMANVKIRGKISWAHGIAYF